MTQQLIFVYNADSGLFNLLNDFAHKIISPSTYQCNLCALTYGNFTIKNEWKLFIESLPVTTSFLHKDEFQNIYKTTIDLPAVLVSDDGKLSKLIDSNELNNCHSLQQLKSLVASKLSANKFSGL